MQQYLLRDEQLGKGQGPVTYLLASHLQADLQLL